MNYVAMGLVGLSVWLGYLIGWSSIAAVYSVVYISYVVTRLGHKVIVPDSIATPLVSIIVPSYNDAEVIEQCLQSIVEQTYVGNIQVVMVNDGSTDATPHIMRRYAEEQDFTLVHLEENSGSKAKPVNTAIRTIGEDDGYIVILDADTVLDNTAIANAVSYMESSPDKLAACGHLVVHQNNGLLGLLQKAEVEAVYSLIREVEGKKGNLLVIAGAYGIYRSNAFELVGDYQDWLVEDVCWTWKARALGHKIGFMLDSYATTMCPTTLSGLCKQRRRWARGRLEALPAVADIGLRKIFLFVGDVLDVILNAASLVIVAYSFYVAPVAALMLTVVHMLVMGLYANKVKVYAAHPKRTVGSMLSGAGVVVLTWLVSGAVALGLIDELFKRNKDWGTKA